MATAMLLSCTKTHMAVMADDDHSFQTEGSPNDRMPILESVHSQESNREVPADGSRTDEHPVEVFTGSGGNNAVASIQDQPREDLTHPDRGQQLDLIKLSAVGASAFALGYMNQNLFNQQRRREAQTRGEDDEANMRIRQLEELLAAAKAKQSLQTSVVCYGHAATLGHNNGNHSPHLFDASRLYSMNPVWASLGVGTFLAGGYVARKVSRNFHAMHRRLATERAEKRALEEQLRTTKNKIATEIAEKRAVEGQLTTAANQLATERAEKRAVEGQLRTATEQLATEKAEKRAVEGQLTWKQYFGGVGAAPPLPTNINEVLNSSCPFWPGKLVKDTHLLVLVPATVDGRPFTLNLLGDLVKSPKGGGSKTEYGCYDDAVKEELGAQSPRSSYWVLMTRDVLPGSRGKAYDAQEALVAAHASRLNLPYEMPDALSAATAILLHHARTGERLYTDAPCTYTRCQEKVLGNEYPVVVGGFSSGGIDVHSSYRVHDHDDGVSCLRKF
jgi:hypothetical protein